MHNIVLKVLKVESKYLCSCTSKAYCTSMHELSLKKDYRFINTHETCSLIKLHPHTEVCWGGQFWEWSANEVQIWPLPPWDIKRRLHLLWSLYIVSPLLQKWGRNCKTIHIPAPVMLLLLLGVKLRFIPMKVDIWQCSYVVATHETIIILTSTNIWLWASPPTPSKLIFLQKNESHFLTPIWFP